MKIEIPEEWWQTSNQVFNDPDDEDLWQARCGDYTLDIGSQSGVFRCRAIKKQRWAEPIDDVSYESADSAALWAQQWIWRLM